MTSKVLHLGASWGTTSPSYIGPGDVSGYSGASYYWGLRAYNAVKAAALVALINICDQNGANALTVHCLSNGAIDLATINAWVTAHSVTRINVTAWYDQINNVAYPAMPNDLTFQPNLILNEVGGQPAIHFDGGNLYFLAPSISAALAQPITCSFVCKNTLAGSGGVILGDGNFNFNQFSTADGNFRQDDGSPQDYTGYSWGSFHAVQSVNSGASSSVLIDSGSIQAGNPGTNGIAGTNKISIGSGTDTGSAIWDGELFEVLILPTSVSSGAQAVMNTNQHAIGTGW